MLSLWHWYTKASTRYKKGGLETSPSERRGYLTQALTPEIETLNFGKSRLFMDSGIMEVPSTEEELVYGGFLDLLKTKVSGSVEEFRELDVELKNLDVSLFVGFISYIFARVGYYNRTIYENSRYWGEDETGPILSAEGRRTTDNSSEMWIDEVGGLMAWSEELNELRADGIDAILEYPERLRGRPAWSHYFEKADTKAKAKVIFTSREAWKSLPNETLLNFLDPSCSNYVITHPVEEKFSRSLSMHSVSFLSVDEFAEKFIPTKEERCVVLKNWTEIRNEALKRFGREQHMLVEQSQTIRKLANVPANRMRKLSQKGYRKPASSTISPGRPYSNMMKIIDTLRSCRGYIHWLDKYFDGVGLEWLSQVLDHKRIREIKILMAIQPPRGREYHEKFRNHFKKFQEECNNVGISCELRILNREIEKTEHDRWIVSESKCFNVPSTDTIARGQRSLIKKVNHVIDRPPFDDLWKNSKDIIKDWQQICRELVGAS